MPFKPCVPAVKGFNRTFYGDENLTFIFRQGGCTVTFTYSFRPQRGNHRPR